MPIEQLSASTCNEDDQLPSDASSDQDTESNSGSDGDSDQEERAITVRQRIDQLLQPLREHTDPFLRPIRDSAIPEAVTFLVSAGRIVVGAADSFITRSPTLAGITVGTSIVGLGDDILYFVSNEPEFRVDEDGNWLHTGPRWSINVGVGARFLTTLADIAMLALGIWSLVVISMPEVDENTPLLQGIGRGETASGVVSGLSGIVSGLLSYYFARRGRDMAEAAQTQAEAAQTQAEAAQTQAEAERDILGFITYRDYVAVLDRITLDQYDIDLNTTALSRVLLTGVNINLPFSKAVSDSLEQVARERGHDILRTLQEVFDTGREHHTHIYMDLWYLSLSRLEGDELRGRVRAMTAYSITDEANAKEIALVLEEFQEDSDTTQAESLDIG